MRSATLILVGSLATSAFGCRSTIRNSARLAPRASDATTFAPPRPAGRVEWTFYQQRRGDAVERPIGHVETSETLDAASTRLLIATHWLPPFESIDTMLVDATTLAPMREYSRSPQLTFTYRYDRAHVVGTLQHADSTPHEVGGSYGALVFGFNELDQLARSLEGPPGTRVVLPFFSEADAHVEHDTLSVLRDNVVDGAPARVVRFADPVIVRLYFLTTSGHEIVESDITQRRSGTRFRLIPVRQPSGVAPPSPGVASAHYRLLPRGRTQPDTTEWSVEQRPVTDHRRVAALQVMTSRRGSAVTVDSVVYDPQTLVAYSERTFGADTQVVAFGKRATGWQSTSTQVGFATVTELAAHARARHDVERAYVASLSDAALDELIEIPFRQSPLRIPRGQAPAQSGMHSQHHRAQNATRLRELGGEPPTTDLILWYWLQRPIVSWGVPA